MLGAESPSKALRHAGWHERLRTQPLALAALPLSQNQMNQPWANRALAANSALTRRAFRLCFRFCFEFLWLN